AGIEAAFSDIEEAAARCRFRDCRHENEPGCAVRAAVEAGDITAARWESYRALKQETVAVHERREQARWMSGQKKSNDKSARKEKRIRGRRA
ncbi:MAG: ribosome small subunit-dependent GTPase A, partial [Eggerthellaceae bacterium]|nr:ribosome small subunit-dependent GTPase A [Eggerthellaceae bacterium]